MPWNSEDMEQLAAACKNQHERVQAAFHSMPPDLRSKLAESSFSGDRTREVMGRLEQAVRRHPGIAPPVEEITREVLRGR